MAEHVHVHIANRRQWRTDRGTHVCGSAFWKGQSEKAPPLLDVFKDVRCETEFIHTLQRLNGFFSVILERGDEILAAVDHMRGHPLFYAQRAGSVYLSDDAHWVRDQVGDSEFDPTAALEFTLAGYVTGPDTLYANVKQLQAAEALRIASTPDGARCTARRYYRYVHERPLDIGAEETIALHEEALNAAFSRLVNWANGRHLCIPLSGGYDSRLVAVMLKRLGHDNLIAFTYGKAGNSDAAVSRDVARRLGIPWHFVPYSSAAWNKWFHSEERSAYYRYADGLCSLPHPQDWPAVWELKKAGVLPDDTAFVPGHTGVFIAGKHIPACGTVDQQLGERWLLDAILTKHYALPHSRIWHPRLRGRLRPRILERSEAGRFASPDDVASVFEKWQWQERNAKFLVNSVRVYEFWGYAWWVPLWDADFLDFWSRVPLRHRVDKHLYKMHVSRLYAETTGLSETAARATATPTAWKLKKWVMRTWLDPVWRLLRYPIRRYTEYDHAAMAWYGVMSRRQFRRLYTGRNSIYPFLALERLGRVTFEPEESR